MVDADWPPVSGVAGAEDAWATMHKRIRVFEARVARGERGDELRRPVEYNDPALDDEDLRDPHRNRTMPEGLQSWSKNEHLERLATVGHFVFVREIVLNESVDGDAERFIALLKRGQLSRPSSSRPERCRARYVRVRTTRCRCLL
ncbi:MAG TPA: hypothetical protein VK988_02710 [Acidimicrobiales bacterium]|nr:hypothetical protein [Acidimicrobiales bacterium]